VPRTSNRLDRISDQLKKELACMIREELRDPRLGMVSVIDARVSRDLSHADIFFTVMGADSAEAAEALNHASGYLRTLLAKKINLRATPKLRFIFDESVERGRYLSTLIDQAIATNAPSEDEEPESGSASESSPEK